VKASVGGNGSRIVYYLAVCLLIADKGRDPFTQSAKNGAAEMEPDADELHGVVAGLTAQDIVARAQPGLNEPAKGTRVHATWLYNDPFFTTPSA